MTRMQQEAPIGSKVEISIGEVEVRSYTDDGKVKHVVVQSDFLSGSHQILIPISAIESFFVTEKYRVPEPAVGERVVCKRCHGIWFHGYAGNHGWFKSEGCTWTNWHGLLLWDACRDGGSHEFTS